MKSAFILAKDDQMFPGLAAILKMIGYKYVGGSHDSICLNTDHGCKFTLYNRGSGSNFFEKYEIPEEALHLGYKFGYLVECRSETLFCEIVGRIPPEFDILVCDSNGVLHAPNQLNPNTIIL